MNGRTLAVRTPVNVPLSGAPCSDDEVLQVLDVRVLRVNDRFEDVADAHDADHLAVLTDHEVTDVPVGHELHARLDGVAGADAVHRMAHQLADRGRL
jgi:hypothetical protein